MVRFPVLIVNFKAYKQATGENAIHLAQALARVKKETGVEIIAVPQHFWLSEVAKVVPSFCQHLDAVEFGSRTGHILPEAVKTAGAIGTLLNHSERAIGLKAACEGVKRSRECGLVTCVCAENAELAGVFAGCKPDMVAVEPRELIGKGKSISTESPEAITRSIELVKEINPETHVLCGAGVSTGEDVRKALELGAEGILVASAIVCAKDPYSVALEMAKAMGE